MSRDDFDPIHRKYAFAGEPVDPTPATPKPEEETPRLTTEELRAREAARDQQTLLEMADDPQILPTDRAAARYALQTIEQQRAEIERLKQENESLRQQKVRVDEWGLQMLEPLGEFLRKSLAVDHPMTTHIEATFPDMPDAGRVPVLHLWATTSETEPAARCRELAMAREHAIEQREALRARLSAAEELAAVLRPQVHREWCSADDCCLSCFQLSKFLAPADRGKG
jgi:hypothetical protein